MSTVGLKELRENVEKFAKAVARGESFVVLRRSKPIFVLKPFKDEDWELVVDFTKIKKGGVHVDELLARL